MSPQPPEYVPERTESQRIADAITRATQQIRSAWPHMHRPGDTQAPGLAARTGVHLDDHDPRDVDTRRIDRTISKRRLTTDQLHAWCTLVMEDRPVTNPKALPLGDDVPAMTAFIERHAEWLSWHETGHDCRDELKALAHDCHLIAFPTRRESMSIGRCPLQEPDDDGHLTDCGGDVRYRLEHDERDGEAMATCTRCGQCAVITWWESKLFDDPEAARTLTADGVVALIHRQYGEVIRPATVRQWVKRGIIEPKTTTHDSGRTLFDRDAIVYAIDRWKRLTHTS